MTDTQDPVTEAALALLVAARENAEANAAGQPETLRFARILCRVAGFDPDMVVMGVPDQEPIKGPRGTIGIYAPMSPAWALYWDDAVAAMAAERGESVFDAPADGVKVEASDARQDSTV